MEILESPQNVPARYSLSARAAKGILRRAEKRGRRLPPHLLAALLVVAEGSAETTLTGGGRTSLSGLGSGGPDDNDAQAGRLVAVNLRGREDGAQPELDELASLRVAEGGSSRSYVIAETPRALTSHADRQDASVDTYAVNAIAFHSTGGGAKDLGADGRVAPGTGTGGTGGISVRRLTPVECERLQALPDGWTDLGDTPDSCRYSGLGDAVAATVVRWIGERLAQAA